MNRFLHIVTLLLVMIVSSHFLNGQVLDSTRYIHSVKSINANYIYCLGYHKNKVDESEKLANTAYFILERYELTGNDPKSARTGVKKLVRPVETEAELQKLWSEKEIENFKNFIKASSTTEVIEFLKDKKNPRDYGLSYLALQTKLAAGHIFKDTDILPNKTYLYTVKRLDKSGNEENWGYAIITPDYTNYTLKYLTPTILKTKVYDSSVLFQWYLDVSNEALKKVKKPQHTSIYQQRQIFTMHASIKSLQTEVHSYSGGGYVNDGNILGRLSNDGDSLVFTYAVPAFKGEVAAAYVRLKDQFGNEGLNSDTAYAYAITEKNMPLLYSLKSESIVDGIRLSWDPVPYAPYIAGIQITRSNSKGDTTTFDILSKLDTVLIDRHIEVGQTYYYSAKLMFSQGVELEQKVPAEATGQYTKFSRPLIPENLTARNENKQIRLEWEYDMNSSIFGFYVYRGLNKSEMQLLAGPIKDTTFLDSSYSLSGRSTYYYSVMAQNLREDTSNLSQHVEITPDRSVLIDPPKNVKFYFTNGNLYLNWDDIERQDDALKGYRIQKKGADDEDYKILSDLVKSNAYNDTTVLLGDSVTYKIACISNGGDVGIYSDPFDYSSKIIHTEKINRFALRNIESAIVLSIPSVSYSDRVSYNVYRRSLKEDEFKKIGLLDISKFEFIDDTVIAGEEYIYTLSINFKDNQESKKGAQKSIKRRTK